MSPYGKRKWNTWNRIWRTRERVWKQPYEWMSVLENRTLMYSWCRLTILSSLFYLCQFVWRQAFANAALQFGKMCREEAWFGLKWQGFSLHYLGHSFFFFSRQSHNYVKCMLLYCIIVSTLYCSLISFCKASLPKKPKMNTHLNINKHRM